MPARIALLFPGQGAYIPGSLARLTQFPEVHEVLEDVDSVAREYDIGSISALLLDTDAPDVDELLREAPDALQVAIFAGSLAISRVMTRAAGLGDVVLVGHSLGEFTALTAAGVYSVADGARVLCERDRLVREADLPAGGLMAVALSVRQAALLTAELGLPDVEIAAHNAPRQTVLSGPDSALRELARELTKRDIRATRLQSPYPYHHTMMGTVAEELARTVADVPVHPLALPVYSTLHLRHYQDADDITALMTRHLVTPVSFLEALRELQEDGTDFFVEAGARTALTGIARGALGHIQTVAPLDGVPSAEEFTQSLARIPGTKQSFLAPEQTPEERSGSLLSELRGIYAEALEFPEEFLEPTTEFEGDLGVDSVQQTELLSRVMEHYGLPQLPDSFRISQYSTLQAVADMVAERGTTR